MTYPTLLPSNSTKFERDMEQVQARLHEVPIDFEKLWRVEECPIELLPWLAWALSVDYWSSDWSEEKKRAVVNHSLYIHQHKGTIAAVKRALILANAEDAQLTEWFEYGGKPKTFQIILPAHHPAIATQSQQKEMLRLVFDAKPCAAHLGFPNPTDPEILVHGLKITESFSQFDPIRVLLAGNVHDLRQPSYDTQLQFKIPEFGIVLAHLQQKQPIPLELFIKHPTQLNGYGVNKRLIFPKKYYVDVFKPIPEGEISAGQVKVTFSANHNQTITGLGAGQLPTENAIVDDQSFPITSTAVMDALIQDDLHFAEFECFIPHSMASDCFSQNMTPRPQFPNRVVTVFKPIPEGEIGIGSVVFNTEMTRKITTYSMDMVTEVLPNAQLTAFSYSNGLFFSLARTT